MKTYRSRLLATTLAFSASLVAVPAVAQIGAPAADVETQESPSEDIVVTGSRIRRPDLTSSSPIAVVSSEEFQLSGAVNVDQVINTLPQVVPGLTGFSNNPGNGASTLNLRGLAETRTLVLVNGRRWMFYNTNQIVDLNTIPQFLLRNTEVVTGGASAIYGSDAVAGVVNFNLRNDLNGIEAGANYQLTERGDGARYTFDFAMGTNFADGRGNVTAYANYTRRTPIFQSARTFSRTAAGDGCIVPGSANPTTRIGTPFPSGIAAATCLARGGEIGLIPQGSPTTPRASFNVGPNTFIFDPTGGGSRIFQDPQDLYNFAPDNYLMLPQERYLIGGYGNYQVNDNIEAYAELSYVNNSVPQELAPTPIGQAASLQIASPFFNEQTRALLRPLDTDGDGYVNSTVNFRFNQSGPRNVNQQRDAFRILGGLRGDITPNLRYDAYYLYSRTQNTQLQRGNISRSRFAQSLNTAFLNPALPVGQQLSGTPNGGTLVCANSAARDAGCRPLNAFGLGQASQAAINYVTINSTNVEVSDLKNAVASVSGELFDLGLGGEKIGFAVGGEYRAMSSRYIPDTFLASGDVAGFNAGLPTSGGYNVKEVFGEIRVPVLRDTLFHRLDLNGAGRYSDYSLGNVGGVWTYTGGVEFAPVRDVTLRGQYARSVRAPNVQDLFGGNATGFPVATDYCSDRGAVATRTAAVRALCIASGVPEANVFTRAVQPATQIQVNTGGNPNVREETSDTWTAGVVFSPSFIPRLNVQLDWFDINVNDAIGTRFGGPATALELCYLVAQNINDPVCAGFVGTRGPTGAIGQTQGGTNPNFVTDNTASLQTRGIDLTVDYGRRVGNVDISFFYLGTYLERYRSVANAAFPERVNISEGVIAGPSVVERPKYRHTARVTAGADGALLSLRWRFQGKGQDDRIDNVFLGTNRVGTDPAILPNAFIGSVSYFDLTASIDVTDGLTFNFGVNNLFDKQPPILGTAQEQANTRPSFYDVLGRDFFVSARVRL